MLARWLLVVVALVVPAVAQADAFTDALGKLASEDLDTVRSGVQEIASSGEARALGVLHALRDGKLKVDGETVVVEDGSKWKRASDGSAITPAAKPRKVVANNAVRRAMAPAIARLELTSKDVGLRRAAAEELRRGTPPEELAPVLREAYKTEKDPQTKASLELALADVDLASADSAKRFEAVRILGDRGDISFKSKLEPLVERDADGNYREKDAKVREAAADVLSSLRWKELTNRIVGDVMYGLSLGSVLLLAALGLAITFGLMGVINMAHGEILMIGAYSSYVVQLLFQQYLPSSFDMYIFVALPVAFVVCALVGILIERTILRFLYGRPLETLLATWGVSLALIQTVRLLFGAQNVAVTAPSFLSGGWEMLEGVVLPYNRMVIVFFGALVVAFVWVILTRTRLGLEVRAVTQNRNMAACMGISTARVDMWTFGIGSGVAGLGGVALSQIGNVGPELGQNYIVDSFMVVVLGGVGKLAGTVIGAFGLGIINKLLEPVSGAVLGKIIVLGLIILFIQKRPQGIFALKGRAVEG
ncbi:MAG TPA: urea ABC transporter permease subunit UrtB [Polyangiales bacterium]|nr:urea ABC transporter permease subunit UrtB [Polyangiales bacterium]